MTSAERLPTELHAAAETLWRYHRLGHDLRPSSAALALGSHDIGVADHAARLYHRGLFPVVVCTGANSPTTRAVFPRGEAVHYRERLLERGVPERAVVLEPKARHTGENIVNSRRLLDELSVHVGLLTIVTRPYHERRAFVTSRRHWPEVRTQCSSQEIGLDAYMRGIGDPDRVVHMLVGDTQRIWLYAERGLTPSQEIPAPVIDAYELLVAAGFTRRVTA